MAKAVRSKKSGVKAKKAAPKAKAAKTKKPAAKTKKAVKAKKATAGKAPVKKKAPARKAKPAAKAKKAPAKSKAKPSKAAPKKSAAKKPAAKKPAAEKVAKPAAKAKPKAKATPAKAAPKANPANKVKSAPKPKIATPKASIAPVAPIATVDQPSASAPAAPAPVAPPVRALPPVGEKAPDFSLPADDGSTVSLSGLAGKKVVLYFYPKDDTPGCTIEAIAFSTQKAAFEEAGTVVLGVSKDSVDDHCKFRDKHNLTVRLLSDEGGKMLEDYGVWGEKNLYGRTYMGIERTTFLIDGEGILRKVWPKVKVEGHADEVLAAAKAL